MNTNVYSIEITLIDVPPRRREEYGDLDALAENINIRGLLHAIVVAGNGDRYKLAAGERRLKACRDKLGWPEIPCRLFSELSEDERLAIELEENLFRKDLTPYEQSKNLVALADVAAKVLQTEGNEFPSTVDEKSEATSAETPRPSKGRPAQAVSKDKVAERVGVPRATIARAEQHVAAVEKHSDLKDTSQKEAIQTAKARDSKQSSARSALKPVHRAPIPKPGSSNDTFSPVEQAIYDFEKHGGVEKCASRKTQQEQFVLLDRINLTIKKLQSASGRLTDELNDYRAEAVGE